MLPAIRSLPAYQELIAGLGAPGEHTGLGLIRSARLPVLSALVGDLKRPILLVTDRSARALTLLDELGFWAPEIEHLYFPAPNPLFYESSAWGNTTRRDRLNVLSWLSRYHIPGAEIPATPMVVIAPVRALMARTLPRRDFLRSSKLIHVNQNSQPEAFQRTWVDIGYQNTSIVVEPGQFSRRGGILDVWPPAEPFPVRLEFFGDEIETLRRFDPSNQRTLQKLESLLVTPAREVLPGTAANLALAVQDPDEFYLPVVHPALASLLDYLPQQALVVLDDLDTLQMAANDIEERSVKARQDLIWEGTLPGNFPVPYLTWSEILDNLEGHEWLELGRSTAAENAPFSGCFSSGNRFGGRLKNLNDHLAEQNMNGNSLVIVSRQVSRLQELWLENPNYRAMETQPEFIEGTLGDGWVLTLPDGKQLRLLTDSEIFGWERPQPRRPARAAAETPEAGYADLKPGDWVVHVDFGIGRFEGLVQRSVEGTTREFLCVDYDGGAQVFVPVHQADRLSRYIGPGGEAPAATRLGTGEWSHAKEKVRAAVQEVARELLELYAMRQVATGFSFSPDLPWQKELEASFPYIETKDQLTAIQEVKRDMQNPRPMDRLLCGDVGYGKTEVALRAAFKAVMDGKQVALLVPTTVLAQQHFETFAQRLAAYPVTVDMLSRFRSPREQTEILKRLETGMVDIIIGTHRLIQSDVVFKDLGLVIIDEEQRFGVTHKESLKKLRTEVDVLTLTATPIPRTLYMALTGVRDISTINTPPEERLPIITHIGPYSPRLVRLAILRELERGGQVFFVHNRVQTIHGIEAHLHHLVPEAQTGIAHGQMHEAELSQVMQRFTHGEIDVLLCTSIIESGLDIPNANTLIVDRGDAFGLAQLYQLRGRVGRGAQRAYAYFFRHAGKNPTQEGQERLEVIAENSQLGAGYSIAMRDLEMRGAGELLGTRQSGFIATVGFHLYTRMLSMAVREHRQGAGLSLPAGISAHMAEARLPVSVELPLSVGIPVDYVTDQAMRLRLYRRLADLDSEEDLQAMEEELKDRFGKLPDAVNGLFFQLRVKVLAESAGLASVSMEGDQIVLRFPPLPEGVASRNLPQVKPEMRAGKNAYWLQVPEEPGEWKTMLLNTLSDIIALWQPS